MAERFTRQLLGTLALGALLAASAFVGAPAQAQVQAPARKPNILVIMGDDVGWLKTPLILR